MPGTMYNNLRKQEQKDWYRTIAQFGDKKEIPLGVINAVLLLGNLESRGFRPDAESGTGASGLFQFTSGRWTDIKTAGNKWYDDTNKQLQDWGYKPGELKMDNPADQITVLYAEVASYTKEFMSATQPDGKRDTKHYNNAWTAYDRACKELGKECLTDPYQRYILFVQAAHHGPSKIEEVTSGWKKQVLPNIQDNYDFLKSKRGEWKMKVSQDDTSSESERVAEAAERDSGKTTPAEQPADAYQKELAGSDGETETARRGGNSDRRSIPNTWMADAGNVYSDGSDAFRSAFRAEKERMSVEKAPDAMKLPEAPTGFPADPGSPLQHAFNVLGLSSKDIHLTPAMDYGNMKPDSFDMVDKGTSEIIGSCVTTPNGCEMTAGDKKVMMNQLSDSDVRLESYAGNDEGDFELLATSRIGDNDGVTTRRPFMG